METCIACGGSGICSGCSGRGEIRGLTCPGCQGLKHCPARHCEAGAARLKRTVPDLDLRLRLDDEPTDEDLPGVAVDPR